MRSVLINGCLRCVEPGVHSLELPETCEPFPNHLVYFGETCNARVTSGILTVSIFTVEDGVGFEIDCFNIGPLTLSFEDTAILNFTEKEFIHELKASLSRPLEGASRLFDVVGNGVWTRAPLHADELVKIQEDINRFQIEGEVLCVSRKKAKPKYDKCPTLLFEVDVTFLVRKSSLGELVWRRCGASLSTLMRHLQKSPELFQWRSDEKRTFISRVF
jgi:hypothetical protein